MRLVTGGRDYWAVTAARLYLRFAAQKGCLRNQAITLRIPFLARSPPPQGAHHAPNPHPRVTSSEISPHVYHLVNMMCRSNHLYLLSPQPENTLSIFFIFAPPTAPQRQPVTRSSGLVWNRRGRPPSSGDAPLGFRQRLPARACDQSGLD